MVPYLVLALVPTILSVLPVRVKQFKTKNFPIYVFFIFYFLLLALRHPLIGNDTQGYLNFFNTIEAYSWYDLFNHEWETGFVILTKLISFITKDQQVYLAVISFITVLPFVYLYSREDRYNAVKMSIFLVLPTFTMAFSGLRQSIAISLGLLVYQAVKDKKIIIYLLLSLLALFFHRSAFLLFLLYPVYHIKLRKKYLPIYIALFLVVFIFRNPIFGFLSAVIGDFYTATLESTGAYSMLIIFVLFAVFSFIIPDDSELGEEGIGLRNILLVACFLQSFVPLNNLAMRFNYYFIVFIPLLIPKVLENSSYKWHQVSYIATYVIPAFFIVFFILRFSSGNVTLNIVPYHFFWETVI